MKKTIKRRDLMALTGLATLPAEWTAAAEPAVDPKTFFARPQMTGAAFSPDGKRLALRSRNKEGRAMLSVLDLDTLTPFPLYAAESDDVQSFFWVNNDRLAFTLGDLEAPVADQDAGPGLFAVNRDGKNFRQLVERQRVWVKNGSDQRNLLPWNTLPLGSQPSQQGPDIWAFRIEAYDGKDVGYMELLSLNTATGFAREMDAPLHSEQWWVDREGRLRLVQTRHGNQATLQWRADDAAPWKTLKTFDPYLEDGNLRVQGIGVDGQVYVAARRSSDKLAIWTLDPATGQLSDKPLAQSPQFDVHAHLVQRQDKVLGLRFTIDAEVTQWLDADMQALQQQIDKVLPRTVNRLSVPWSGSEPWVMIEAFADVQPSVYYLFNRGTRKFTKLGAARPDIDPKRQAAMDIRWIKSRDEHEFPVWVSTPNGSTGKSLPTLVLVHGGPWVKNETWAWDAEVQYLNALGYAVLQPQFRGTLGLGAAWENASRKQWGQAMQDDVAEATRWAIAQGIADPKRIAIMGASYGGYATLMGLARDPELYRCGVAWVGVTDLDLLYGAHWSDSSDAYKRFSMPTLVGDRVKDAAMLKANSPIHIAAKIRQPVLLAYGEKDQRVPIEHGKAMRKALADAGNTQVDWVTYPKEGHGWIEPATKVEFWTRVAQFLARNLA